MDRAARDLSALRALPQVQRLLESGAAAELEARHGRGGLVAALRVALDRARAGVLVGDAAPDADALIDAARAALEADAKPGLRRVINATGIVIHTNLGRAPLAAAALEAMAEVGSGYSNLEFDLEAGGRGHRTQGVEPLLCALTGAEAALAVNNAAAAVLLALSALAGAHPGGGEVVVSRGELVEIGGGFRVPDVIAQGGARLVEVGTTNKTRLADYRDAITERTRVLLKVHASNYRVVGFTESTPVTELAVLARERGLLVMHDLGAGALVDLSAYGRPREPTVREALAAGADLVAFSGDKLMGGPQAGLIVGRGAALAPLRRHPLLRAVRLDKTTLAALEATLRLYRAGRLGEIPVLRTLMQTTADLAARAERLAHALGTTSDVRVEASEGFSGGGSLPGEAVESRAVTLGVAHPDALAARVRRGRPAVVGRVADGRLVLDLLAVADAEVEPLAAALKAALDPA